MIYVYTTIVNGWDNLRPPATHFEDGVRFICYTNVPNLPAVYPWEYRPIYQADIGASRVARVAKILPHLMLPTDAEYSIYHDGNFSLRVSPGTILDELLRDNDWASYAHPGRNCVYKEADILIREKIGTTALVEKEIASYRERKYPENNGLRANGFIVRRHTIRVRDLNETWWKFFLAGCERDQLSFPVASWHEKFDTLAIEGDVFNSKYLLFRWHAAWRTKLDNPTFWEMRDRVRERLGRLQELVGPAVGLSFSLD